MVDRRRFLAGATGLLAARMTGAHAQGFEIPQARPAIVPLGLQLDTVGRDLARDYVRTMRRVRAIGIRHVQAGLVQNGMDATRQKKIYDDLGIHWDSIPAEGDALREKLPATLDAAARVGVSNITCSFPLYPLERERLMAGPSLSDWQRNAEALNRCGMICRGVGVTFSCYNHNLEFRPVGRVVPYDLLIQATAPSLVQMEMNIAWIVAAGADPAAYLRKYPDRIHAVHIGDLRRTHVPNTALQMAGATVGRGIIDWKKVLPALHRVSITRACLDIAPPHYPSAMAMVRASFNRLDGYI